MKGINVMKKYLIILALLGSLAPLAGCAALIGAGLGAGMGAVVGAGAKAASNIPDSVRADKPEEAKP